MSRPITRLACGLALAAALAVAAVLPAGAQAPAAPAAPVPPAAAERLAADLREEIHRVSVSVKDLYGRQESGSIAVTVFRPAGDGPFPAVLFSHGRAVGELRAGQGRQRYEHQARWLVSMGFVVFVPTRLGYGDTYGAFDPEESGPCDRKRYEPMAQAAADQLLAVMAHAAALPYVDRQRWLAMGVSVGGLSSLSLASRRPPGLLAAVNFAGGAGGDPKNRPGAACGTEALSSLWRDQGAASGGLPTLWIHWTHDRYWGREVPLRWVKAWQDGGGQSQFHHLGPWGHQPADGHTGLGLDMNTWVPLVEAFLRPLGFADSGVVTRPAASGFAGIDEAGKVPISRQQQEQFYRVFLAQPKPRAFAIGPDGAVGWQSGDWALGRALGNCQWRRGQPCRLYAVDDDVVWIP